jgi:hypothetical protein
MSNNSNNIDTKTMRSLLEAANGIDGINEAKMRLNPTLTKPAFTNDAGGGEKRSVKTWFGGMVKLLADRGRGEVKIIHGHDRIDVHFEYGTIGSMNLGSGFLSCVYFPSQGKWEVRLNDPSHNNGIFRNSTRDINRYGDFIHRVGTTLDDIRTVLDGTKPSDWE